MTEPTPPSEHVSADASRMNWRGGRRQTRAPARRRWQSDWTAQTQQQSQRWTRLRRLRFGGLLAACLTLLALLVYVLTYGPRQTPTLAVIAPAYDFPLPPWAWSREDAVRLADLNGAILAMHDDSDAWRSLDRGMRSFDRQLRQLAERGSSRDGAIVYLAMHGAVDGAGRPCLLPPGASPVASETWLPASEILSRIEATPGLEGRPKLLVIDAVRELTYANAGVLYNTFAQRLAEVVEQSDPANLAVLVSTGPGQRSWVSQDLQGSVFAHFFQQGLAGEADQEDGNGDDSVSLHELARYLRRRVDAWTQANRAARQQPMLLPADVPDFRVSWAMSRRSRERLNSGRNATVSAADAMGPDLDALWLKHDGLALAEARRYSPLAWQDFEQRLLWLEEAVRAGAAYRTRAATVAKELAAWTARVEQRTALASQQGDQFSQENVFEDAPTPTPNGLQVSSLAAAERLGTLPRETMSAARSALAMFLESAGRGEDLARAVAAFPESLATSETHFTRMLNEYRVADLWPSPPLRRAVQVRMRGEELAASNSIQAFYWMRSPLQAADAARRQAEDQLFIGADAATPEDRLYAEGDALSRLWDDAESAYDQAERHGEDVRRALQLSDRAFAELSYFARWIVDPLGGYGPPAEVTREIKERLLPLLERSHALAADVAEHRPYGDDDLDAPPFAGRLDAFEEALAAVRKVLTDRIAAMENERTSDPARLREIEAILRLPLIPARSRQALRERFAELAQQVHTMAPRPKPPSRDDQDDAGYLTHLATHWREHPVLALLRASAADDRLQFDRVGPNEAAERAGDEHATDTATPRGVAGIAEAKGAEVRRHLRALPQRVAALCEQRLPRPAPSDAQAERFDVNGSPESLRARWSRAERLTRAAAGFWFPSFKDDPVAGLRRLDRQQWLLWRVDRTLDDFWAGLEPSDEAFFELAAARELAAAAAVFPLRPETQSQIDQRTALLAKRRDAAERAVSLSGSDILLVDAISEASTTLTLRPAPLPPDALPAGRSVVYLRDEQGRLPGASLGVAPPLASTSSSASPWTTSLSFRGEDLVGRGPVLQAVAMFRGHRYVAPLVLQAPGGTLVEYRPYEYGLARVTVEGSRRRQAAVVFVLDCSQSMSDPEELEAPTASGAPPRQTTRLDVAKSALNVLLDDLAQQSGWRVGVRLFGHRVGWNRNRPEALESLQQTGYGRPIPAGIRPSNDEEQILPVGRFDSVEAGRVSALLETVRPWGETPLYLSLDRALRELDNEAPDVERFVVAITDGANRQTNPRSQDARNVYDVLATNRTRQAKLYIVGFDLPRSELAAESEFRQLASASGGRYVPASNAQELLEALQEALGPGEFTISDAGGATAAREEIGTSVAIDPAPALRQPYVVNVESLREPILLQGGEALQLFVNPLRGRVESVRYEKGSPQFLRLRDEAGETEYLLGVHRPVQRDEGVEFSVSVQRADRRFTSRPAEVWLEVTPVTRSEESRAPSYYFYDAPYEPDTPVPVLRRLAAGWPPGYREAEVRFWCKMERTPAAAVRLEDVADVPPTTGQGLPVPGAPGIVFQVRTQRGVAPGAPFRVALIERHGADSPGVGALRVEMSPTPERVIHQFDAENRLVLHTFEYATAEDPTGLSREILFTSRRDLETGAMYLDAAAAVEITDTGNLIELTAPR